MDLDGCSNACVTPRFVFVTSTKITGVLGGLKGADASCQSLADAAGLPGIYAAWLTLEPESAPAFRFSSIEFKGWYLLPTDPPTAIAQGWSDLTGKNEDVPLNYLRNPIDADEFGLNVGEDYVWSNTGTNGYEHEFGCDCIDWNMIPDELSGGLGYTGSQDKYWTHTTTIECNFEARLYRFQTA